ncbi:unnamed protein product [Albugo candida]|uniref:TRP C-terminal domain-containing protein n=1 Tax=Albugo candida TaxID=65357 RepID=A0A024FUZ5_9STRA|nr:unnamed protein product [Albugo candida]|eukprot:CCI10459.1 unnamed protein product [Albugo candida]
MTIVRTVSLLLSICMLTTWVSISFGKQALLGNLLNGVTDTLGDTIHDTPPATSPQSTVSPFPSAAPSPGPSPPDFPPNVDPQLPAQPPTLAPGLVPGLLSPILGPDPPPPPATPTPEVPPQPTPPNAPPSIPLPPTSPPPLINLPPVLGPTPAPEVPPQPTPPNAPPSIFPPETPTPEFPPVIDPPPPEGPVLVPAILPPIVGPTPTPEVPPQPTPADAPPSIPPPPTPPPPLINLPPILGPTPAREVPPQPTPPNAPPSIFPPETPTPEFPPITDPPPPEGPVLVPAILPPIVGPTPTPEVPPQPTPPNAPPSIPLPPTSPPPLINLPPVLGPTPAPEVPPQPTPPNAPPSIFPPETPTPEFPPIIDPPPPAGPPSLVPGLVPGGILPPIVGPPLTPTPDVPPQPTPADAPPSIPPPPTPPPPLINLPPILGPTPAPDVPPQPTPPERPPSIFPPETPTPEFPPIIDPPPPEGPGLAPEVLPPIVGPPPTPEIPPRPTPSELPPSIVPPIATPGNPDTPTIPDVVPTPSTDSPPVTPQVPDTVDKANTDVVPMTPPPTKDHPEINPPMPSRLPVVAIEKSTPPADTKPDSASPVVNHPDSPDVILYGSKVPNVVAPKPKNTIDPSPNSAAEPIPQENNVLDIQKTELAPPSSSDDMQTYVRGRANSKSGDGSAATIVGGRNGFPRGSNDSRRRSKAAHDLVKYIASAFAGISVALLLFYHFISLDRSLIWPSMSWSPNAWEFFFYIGYVQQMSAISQLTLLKAPDYILDYTDSFSWTNFLIQYPSDLKESPARRLMVIVLGGIVSYADRIEVAEDKILYHVVVGFVAVLSILLVFFFASVLITRRKTKVVLTETRNLPAQSVKVQKYRNISIRTLGLCVLIWYFALYPLSMYASFEISMEIAANQVSNALSVAITVLVVVCFGVLAYSARVILHRSENELRQYETLATWGCLYAEYTYRSRMFFVISAVVQIATGMIIGAMESESTSLISIIILHLLYLLAVFILSPYADPLVMKVTYVLECMAIFNFCLAFAFIQSNNMSMNGRFGVADAFIAINTIVIVLWFIRQLIIFSNYIRVWIAKSERQHVDQHEQGQERERQKFPASTIPTDSDFGNSTRANYQAHMHTLSPPSAWMATK